MVELLAARTVVTVIVTHDVHLARGPWQTTFAVDEVSALGLCASIGLSIEAVAIDVGAAGVDNFARRSRRTSTRVIEERALRKCARVGLTVELVTVG
jgi:hypothetical protein